MPATQTHYTLVFEVKDREAFRAFSQPLLASMIGGSPVHGAVVTGAGWADALSRADRLIELCEAEGVDVPEDLQ